MRILLAAAQVEATEVIESLPSTEDLLAGACLERIDLSNQVEYLIVAADLEICGVSFDDVALFGWEPG